MTSTLIHRRDLGALALAFALPRMAHAGSFEHDWYTSAGRAITQYDTDGRFIGTMSLDDGSGYDTRGIAFGPDGLYVVRTKIYDYFHVDVVDGAGQVLRSYVYGGIGGGATSGDIRFAAGERQFYVSSDVGIYRFDVDGTEGVLDIALATSCMAIRPDGEIVIGYENTIRWFDAQGVAFRNILKVRDPYGLDNPGGNWLYAVRGVAYDPRTNTTFVSNADQVLALEGTTNRLKAFTTVPVAGDIAVTPDGHLLVGSFTEAPRILVWTDGRPGTFTDMGPLGSTQAAFAANKHRPM